jgi:hypothetical protein
LNSYLLFNSFSRSDNLHILFLYFLQGIYLIDIFYHFFYKGNVPECKYFLSKILLLKQFNSYFLDKWNFLGKFNINSDLLQKNSFLWNKIRMKGKVNWKISQCRNQIVKDKMNFHSKFVNLIFILNFISFQKELVIKIGY